MPKGRVFAEGAIKTKASDYHGMARFVRSLPDLATKDVKSVNLELSFEEALKLQLALSSCLHQLNRYNRGRAQGKEMGVLLSINCSFA